MSRPARVFAYHNGFNGVSHYRSWQIMDALKKQGFEVKQIPKRTERLHWDGLTGPCNVPGVLSHSGACEWADVIHTTFNGSSETAMRLAIQAQLKPLIVDIDDDVINIDENNPADHLRRWKQKGEDVVIPVPSGEQDSPEWKKQAALCGGHLVTDNKTGQVVLWAPRPAPYEVALEQLQSAHLVTVSTERLADVYAKYCKKIVVIPNAIDFERWPVIAPPSDGLIRLGLFGSNTHARDWKEIGETLKAILDKYPNVRLCVNPWFVAQNARPGDSMAEMEKRIQFPEWMHKLDLIDNLQTEIYEPCEIDQYPHWLAEKGIDIGLAPLEKTQFNRAKSNLKYLEFSTLGIPGVFSDDDSYNRDVKHGINGFLAGHPKHWYDGMKRLIESADLRRQLGQTARTDVKARYDINRVASKLAAEISALASKEIENDQVSA